MATTAAAQTARPRAMTQQARSHFDRGRSAFEEHDYARAAAEFREGYRIDPHPDFLYTLGQAERLGGHCGAAIEAYRMFLGTEPPPAEVERTEANIERCQEALAKEQAAAPAPSAPAAAATTPPPRAKEAPRPSASTRQSVRPPVITGTERPSVPPSPWYLDWVGDTLTGVGVAGIGVGGTLLVLANTNASDAKRAPTLDVHIDKGDRARDLRAAGAVCSALGAAFVIAGLVRYATRPAGAPPARSTGSAR